MVVGSTGFIGSAISRAFAATGIEVLGTTRGDKIDPRLFRVDLLESPARWRLPSHFDAVVLCAAITGFSRCKENPAITEIVNVRAISTLAEICARRGAYVAYISSNAVFDGTRPFRRPDEPVTPRTEYGHQKAEAERRILALGGGVGVIRLSKVLDPNSSLLQGWRRSLASGHPIEAFGNMSVAPLTSSFVASLVSRIVLSHGAGIFQASGNADISYSEVARIACRSWRIDPTQVLEVPAFNGIDPDTPPHHTTLDMNREMAEFGISQPSSTQAVRDVALAIADCAHLA